MRISDWISDVCSSDLHAIEQAILRTYQRARTKHSGLKIVLAGFHDRFGLGLLLFLLARIHRSYGSGKGKEALEIIVVDRKSGGYGKSVSVRVDLGGGGYIKKIKMLIC